MKQIFSLDKSRVLHSPLKIAIILTTLYYSTGAFAQGNLLVTPKRVLFDGTKKSEELNLANVGKDSATFAISFIQIRMNEDGSFQKITEPDSSQNFADKYLRYFPRTVTLAPNEAQTVKVQLIRAGELKPGEYRSHLYFRAVPVEGALGENVVKKDTSLSVQLVPIFGISVPTIIRVGDNNSQVSLSNVVLTSQDTSQSIKWSFNRTGNMSVYGDVAVNHISTQGKITTVGIVKGVAVYTPTPVRNFNLPLIKTPGVDFRSGKLHIIYSDQTSKSKLAETELEINNTSSTFSVSKN